MWQHGAGMDRSKNRTGLKHMFITCSHCGDVRYAIKATMKRKMCTKQKFRKSPKFYCAIDYCICGKLYVAFKKFYVLLKRNWWNVSSIEVDATRQGSTEWETFYWNKRNFYPTLAGAVSFRLLFLMHKSMKHMEMSLFISKSFVSLCSAHNTYIAYLHQKAFY